MKEPKLSHISKKGLPGMVDVSEKSNTIRIAEAKGLVVFPESLGITSLNELKTHKGPVIQTAIIAGTQGVKRTSDMIPMCHPIPLDGIDFEFQLLDERSIEVSCKVTCAGKTGVEMEALQGVSTACLTIYDMCKSLIHSIRIENIRLASKTGGKSDYKESNG